MEIATNSLALVNSPSINPSSNITPSLYSTPTIGNLDISMNSKIVLPWKQSDHYVPVPILCSWDYGTWQDWLKNHDYFFLDSKIGRERKLKSAAMVSGGSSKTETSGGIRKKGGRTRKRHKLKMDEIICSDSPSLPVSKMPPPPPPPTPENWVMGSMGSKNSLLIFRSSALAAKQSRTQSETGDKSVAKKMPAARLHITYKTQNAETKLITRLLEAHGMSEVPISAMDFNLLWTGCHIKPDVLRSLLPHQRVNHFPRSYELTRKDRLYKNIEKMQHGKGFKQFDFVPQTFVMPAEYKELCATHYRVRGPWIIKPVASSRGRGIHIVNSPDQVPLEEPVVVAKYIGNPLLIGGHKCDLRLYVLVTSFDPLIIYLYEEGLVRFATVPYDNSPRQLWNPCMHLCNYSINKYHCDYIKSDDPAAEDVGHKWTLSALLRHLRCEGRDTGLLMEQIEDLVIKSVLSCAQSIVSAIRMFVPHPANCFELYGFDILIDETLKPWLLEVNLSPSLGCDTPLDVRLKSAMVADLLTLVGIPAVDPLMRHSNPSSTINLTSPGYVSCSSKTSSRSKFGGSCRRIFSAETVNSSANVCRPGGKSSNAISLSPDEHRILRMFKCQYDRRGGYVRIFPTSTSWSKYSQYLDPVTGIPFSTIQIGGIPSYHLIANHNYNHLLHSQLFGIKAEKELIQGAERLDRYERMLNRGHREKLDPTEFRATTPPTVTKTNIEQQTKCDVKKLLEAGFKLTQAEARKAFSQYLIFVLKRLTLRPSEKVQQTELIMRFLQRASAQLRTPYLVKFPTQKLPDKDKGALVAKQLNDFLHLYNRETELYADAADRPNHIPSRLFAEFLTVASESELEEALMLHMERNSSQRSNVLSGSLQVLMRCLPATSPPQPPPPKLRHTVSLERKSKKITN